MTGQGDNVDAKIGMFERIRRMFGSSSSIESSSTPNAYQPQLDEVCDQARYLCPDPWLANKLTLTVGKTGEKTMLSVTPQEGIPYMMAARDMMRGKLSKEVNDLFDNMIAPQKKIAS